MIHIGNQTSFAAATLAPFEYALENHFDAFEWLPDKKPGAGWDETDLDSSLRGRIRRLAGAQDLRQSVHVRWQANPFQTAGLELFWKDLALAQDLGAVLLNVHLDHTRGITAFVEAIAALISRTADCGVQLAIENTPDHAPELFNELFALLRSRSGMSSGHVGMCLDLGHANLRAATRNRYLEFLDRLSLDVRINHVHLHENWGDADTHLPLFTGPAGRNDAGIRAFLERLRQRRYAGSIILEQWPQPPSLLNQARNRLLELLALLPPKPAGGPGGPGAQQPLACLGEVPPAGKRQITAVVQGAAAPLPRLAVPSSFVETLAAADLTAKSWREKLDVVRRLLTEDAEKLTDEKLASVAIYLRFLNTGQLACTEDGRHFRPSHHARAALEIQKRLARRATTEAALILRKIYPWLPSTAAPFQRAEPLTRIRDIAHRNDIPSELKREIKTTLQNKLHRCAGPEDLATSQKLLERVTAPGAAYSAEFVEQFKIFHHELREFFNASSLEDRLISLQARARPEVAKLIKTFLAHKGVATPEGLLRKLRTLTELRRALQSQSREAASEHQHEELLADISLEDFGFSLLSQWLNVVEAGAASEGKLLSEALQLTLKNLYLSEMQRNEIEPMLAELSTWGSETAASQRDDLLRLLATVQRARRLAESQSARIISIFAEPAVRLGQALKLAPEAMKVFSEAEIRNHLIFQLSKLTSLWLRHLRERLELPPWDVLVPGAAVGRVKCVPHLGEFPADDEAVAVVEQATGYEELPAHLRGIVLAHDLPHLSHLAVRARQAGIVLVACEEPALLSPLRDLDGNLIALTATAEGVEWKRASDASVAAAVSRPNTPGKKVAPTDGSRYASSIAKKPLLRLEEFTAEAAGQKAYGIRRLAEIAARSNGAFLVPQAVALPFGSFEAAIRGDPHLESRIRELRCKASQIITTEIRAAATRLPALLEQTPVPDGVVSAVRRAFGGGKRLMVRSSSNCEDLADLAGAGLYESVPNVSPGRLPAAIRRVWASLWTERAMLSRHQAGIPEDQAFMAVLIQEMVLPDFSFVLHTVSPVTHCADEIYVEIAPGLGETLVSGATRGSPYRLVWDKRTAKVKTLAFAHFSEGLWPTAEGGVESRVLDYSAIPLSRDAATLCRWTVLLAKTGRIVEEALGGSQDIEGVITGDRIFLVQARPQQGVPATAS